MYVCHECGEELTEDELIDINGDAYYIGDHTETEKVSACPYCASVDIEEVADMCDCCGDYIFPTQFLYRTLDDKVYCESCIKREKAK